MYHVFIFNQIINTVVTTRYPWSQVKRHPHEYKGDFDAVVLMVGANNLGQYTIRESVKVVNETLNLLSKLNPGARTYACEVSAKSRYSKSTLVRFYITLSDIIITKYIVTDTIFHGHTYSRSTLPRKFLIEVQG